MNSPWDIHQYLAIFVGALWYTVLSYFMARVCFKKLIDAGRPGAPIRFSIVDIYALMAASLIGPIVWEVIPKGPGADRTFLILTMALYACAMWALWLRWVSRARIYARGVRFVTILYGIVFGSLGPMVAVILALYVGVRTFRGASISAAAWGFLVLLTGLAIYSMRVARWALAHAEDERDFAK